MEQAVINQTQLSLIQGDITRQETDAIVNAVITFLRKEATSLKEVVFVFFNSGTYEFYRSALEKMSEEL